MFFVGVDGCKAGWFAVSLFSSDKWNVDVFADAFRLWGRYRDASLLLFDCPIGLRENGSQQRLCDIEARKLLGYKRSSSVFAVPCRAAIYAKRFSQACQINKSLSGHKLSFQIWNITPKIQELDRLLSSDKTAKRCIRETHPEICLWAFAGHPMKYSKKSKEGFRERKQILQAVYPHTKEILDYTLSNYKRSEVSRDDILDALSAAITARLGARRFASIPEAPEHDSCGLPMEILYYRIK